jgi:ligand-binding sensor domain-containing protein
MEKKHFVLSLLVSIGISSCHGQLQTAETENIQPYKNYFKNYLTWYGKDPKLAVGLPIDNYVRAIYQDKKNVFWFGTGERGLCRFDGGSFRYYGKEDGLQDNQVNAIAEDSQGNLWVATNNGLSRYDGKTFETIKSLENERVSSILVDKQGTVWVATDKGFGPVEQNDFRRIFGLDAVTSIYQTSEGKILIGTEKIGVFKFDIRNSTSLFPNDRNLPKNITKIIQDKNGTLWIGTINSGLWAYKGQKLTQFTTESGIGNNEVWTVFEDKKGKIWFSSEGFGVYSFDGENLKNYGVKQGLYIKAVQTISEDKEGRLWIGGGGGLYRFNGENFQNITTGIAADGC